MTKTNTPIKTQRITVFLDPVLVTRIKVRGALEGLTLSEVIEKALEAYVPKIEKDGEQHIHLKFTGEPISATLIPDTHRQVPKHTRHLSVPR